MMTTMAALLGGLPLALGQGMGSELRRPLGIAMVGGLLLSQVLTLYTTPVIYIFFDRIGHRFSRAQKAIERTANHNRQREHEYLRAIHPAASSHYLANRGHHCWSGPSPSRSFLFLLCHKSISRRSPFLPGLPGGSPEITASSIATPLERQFSHIAGVTEMTSSSSLGSTSITLQFDLSRDIDGAAEMWRRQSTPRAHTCLQIYLPIRLIAR